MGLDVYHLLQVIVASTLMIRTSGYDSPLLLPQGNAAYVPPGDPYKPFSVKNVPGERPGDNGYPGSSDTSELHSGKSIPFSWENCGSPTDPITVTKVEVSPDPVPKEDNFFFTVHMEFLEELKEPLALNSQTEKMELGSWVEVECQGFWGTCQFDDICQILGRMATCPPQLMRQVPCKCPFKKGHYEINHSRIRTDLPSYATGVYRSTIAITQNGRGMGCYKINYSVE